MHLTPTATQSLIWLNKRIYWWWKNYAAYSPNIPVTFKWGQGHWHWDPRAEFKGGCHQTKFESCCYNSSWEGVSTPPPPTPADQTITLIITLLTWCFFFLSFLQASQKPDLTVSDQYKHQLKATPHDIYHHHTIRSGDGVCPFPGKCVCLWGGGGVWGVWGGALFQGSGGGLGGGGGQRHIDRFVLLGSKFQSDSMYAHTHKINVF